MDSEAVAQEARDAVFRSLKHEPENLICFQCGSKNPKWASVYMGLLICYNCTTLHRGLGTHISFVRSAELDKWTRRQLAFMECGGNRRAKEFFRRHGQGTAIDYSGAAAERYRVELEEKVSKLYPKRKEEVVEVVPEIRHTEVVKVPDPPKPVEQPKETPLPPAPNKSTVIHVAPVIPTAAPTFKFRKTKATAPPPQFKPVVFHPEEDEFQECNPPQDEHTVTPPIPAAQPPVKPVQAQPIQPQSAQPPAQAFQPPVQAQSSQPAKQAPKPAQKMQEKKAFSSEDFQEQVDAYTRKERMSRFSDARAISSDAYFGREPEETTGSLGEEASRIAELASEKATVVIAIQLKEKALDLYNSLASRFSS